MARPPSKSTPKDFAAEGDVNLSARRTDWQSRHVGAAARALLDEDARYFLHQSLSTPCLTAIKSASGVWLETVDGQRIMDFHGNSVHQLGRTGSLFRAASSCATFMIRCTGTVGTWCAK